MTTTTKTDRVTADGNLIVGITRVLGTDGTMLIGGKKYSAADLVRLLQGRIDGAKEVTRTKAAWKAAVIAEQSTVKSSAALVAAVRKALSIMYSETVPVLEVLGLEHKPSRPLTVAEKGASVAKVKATRAARHTLGRRQRSRVHGVVANSDPAAPETAVSTGPPAETGTVATGTRTENGGNAAHGPGNGAAHP
jgi:hypothetical protein